MIGIIGAMDEEIELLKQRMEVKEHVVKANCDFYVGTLDDKDVVVLKSGIGKVNAAMSTTILHEMYQPDYVINTGSAGGFHDKLEVGDIVISSDVVHHDVDVTAFDYEYGQVPDMPWLYTANPALIEKALLYAKQLDGVNAMKGLISTGDSFMQDADRVAFVREKFPDMIAAEMEAAAIAQVCYQYGTSFVVIRALSDIAGKESNVSFEAFLEKAANHAATLIISMVNHLD
ncbi:5'-methylthioadenosine/S-adenosylhomocysteine nucleosidase [Gracilibacillus halophilus YIM-C55.5]|uniref:5'-methylthioadenosine/S-adenosylhomocysteine nucleosidase n=1 Tax=Gracilibacillus halophilus YIM-C55.5 TaxID=1308866 RepID=N4WBF0_9BACI|nr:5'-methylthioadenosine/S-adenosylhomocysteine nucleosidase [Gracilibacillus halophilus]ENH97603.1 5'-methylthioadenosine/S-adenosylhomocysteine nucleosidase [Gracilibacillus halophilus YIM-C55.5]